MAGRNTGSHPTRSPARSGILVAVFGGVMFARFFGVMGRVQAVAVSYVCVMARLFMVAGCIMPGRFAVMFRRILMVLGRRIVVVGAFVIFRHGVLLLVVGVEAGALTGDASTKFKSPK